MRPVHVYAIQCGDYIKIGVAEDTRTRLAALNLTTPHEMRLVAESRFADRADAMIVEGLMHKLLAPQRLKGEWFALAPVNPAEALRKLYPGIEIETPAHVPFAMADATRCLAAATVCVRAKDGPKSWIL